jgi:hypothetical protein
MLFQITFAPRGSDELVDESDGYYGVLVECKRSCTRSELVDRLRAQTNIVGIDDIVRALDECEGFYYLSPDRGVFGAAMMDLPQGRLRIQVCTVVDLDAPLSS